MTQYQTGLASLFSTHARRAQNAPKQTCACGKEYTLGVNGTVDGCDECTGTDRAANGFILPSQFCTGVDPLRCDNPRCPIHGVS